MHINCHSYFSLRYGIMSPEVLLQEAKAKNISCLALTDINNTSGVLDFVRLSKEYGVRPVVGIDLRNGAEQLFVALAKNNDGFKEMNDLLSYHLHNGEKIPDRAPEFKNVFVIYPFEKEIKKLRENEFIGVCPSDLNKLMFSEWRSQQHKLVVLSPVTFRNKKDFNAHRLLRAIANNTLLSKLSVKEQALPDELFYSEAEIERIYSEYPQLIINTKMLMDNCEIKFEYGKFANKNLKNYTGTAAGDIEKLRSECMKGIKYRYGHAPTEVLERMEKELAIITQMDFSSYFLINWDIITYAQSKKFYYVGRGSGANSMVAYLLRITDVDPLELDLYFERFINPFRSNPPDFDIDFSWTDRDEMTEYIFNRFGRKNTALLGTYSTFKHDAVLRELGKVFGLPPGEIDKLQTVVKEEELDEKQIDKMGKLVWRYGKFLNKIPSHISIHSSGIIISQEEITNYSATLLPPKGYPTTQFSMIEAEDIGLYKFDILSQRGLGKIKDAMTIIKKNKNVDIDIHDVKKFIADETVKKLLSQGKCIGCFYIESPAMRMLLAKLNADDYVRLVAASSIIRPGVAKSGMMREYILRYRDKSAREKAQREIPELYELLKETYGVMVYQEDVIKIAHFFADLSLAEADYLRRGMSWKFKQRNEFWRAKEKFFTNCMKKGYAEKTVSDIWNQIESFANFAFSKGHSASYAVESYQALYLKAYFPLEYMVATLNNGGGFYRKELYVHEARMHGAEILQPCVNKSDALCNIEGNTIHLGLSLIAELEQHIPPLIIKERELNGPFLGLYDFIKRVPLPIIQLRLLIRAGAFHFTKENKKELLWEAHALVNPIKKPVMSELFDVRPKDYQLPELHHSRFDEYFDNMELFGFPLCSPFSVLKDVTLSGVEGSDTITAKELRQHINKKVEIVGYLISNKNVTTSRGDRMYFGNFLDREGRWIDTVHFPNAAKAFPFRGTGCYKLIGKVTVEFDFLSIEISEMHLLDRVMREDE